MIGDGAVTLTVVRLLIPSLTDDNHRQLLDAATHKKQAQVEQLVAALHPQPPVPAIIRKLPAPGPVTRCASVPDCAEPTTVALTRGVPGRRSPQLSVRGMFRRRSGARSGSGTAGRCALRGRRHDGARSAASSSSTTSSRSRTAARTTAGNLQLRCRAHNDVYEAQQHFGPLFVREEQCHYNSFRDERTLTLTNPPKEIGKFRAAIAPLIGHRAPGNARRDDIFSTTPGLAVCDSDGSTGHPTA